MQNIPTNQIKLLIDKITIFYGSKFTSQFKGISESSMLEAWSDMIGHYPWEIISKVVQKLKAPKWKYENFPPTLVEFNNECFELTKIKDVNILETEFKSTYSSRKQHVRLEFSTPIEEYRDEYIKYLLNKHNEDEIYENFTAVYQFYLKAYIKEKLPC